MVRSNQEEKNNEEEKKNEEEEKKNEFNISIKQFKKRCPWVKVRPPRNPCDRHPPKTNRFRKTQRNIVRVDVQYPQEKENYINWPKFKKYLKSKLNNEEMQIKIWLVDEGDLIKIPKNLE